jgi:hypothetical protein
MQLKLIQDAKTLYELMDGDRFICSVSKVNDNAFITRDRKFKSEKEIFYFYKNV